MIVRLVGGLKWDERFVKLDGSEGKLMYYKSRTAAMPRYALNLKGCAVRDDGSKPQKNKSGNFYVFSIYYRSNDGGDAENDDEHCIIPLVRFSTESLSEKMQWIELISTACACWDIINDGVPKSKLNRNSSERELTPGCLAPVFFGKQKTKKSKKKLAAASNQRDITGYPPSRPMHQCAEPSYLSEEAYNMNYHGLLNLALVILFVSNIRLLFDSLKFNGIVILKLSNMTYKGYLDSPLTEFSFVTGQILLQTCVITTYIIETALCRGIVPRWMGILLHLINCNLSLLFQIGIVWLYMASPIFGLILLMQAVISWMKLMSYVHANDDYRRTKFDTCRVTSALICDFENTLTYPRNVTLMNIYYFWFAPTLTYQISFPRNKKIRWLRVLGYLLQIIAATTLLILLVTQTIFPHLDKMVKSLENGTLSKGSFAEMPLNLAIAGTYTWLTFFYLYFHLFLNLCAELLRFGDRVFYKDWWNASDVSTYWRLWNVPVHYWLVRHVYFPCIRTGLSKHVAMVAVFFISAVLHELIISVPFHMLGSWSFIGMMAQIPLVYLTKKIERKFPGSSVGNIIFWISFCIVGQPMALCLYTIDYWKLKSHVLYTFDTCNGPECDL